MNIWMILFVVCVLITQMWSVSKAVSDSSDKGDDFIFTLYLVSGVMHGGFWLLLSLTGFWSLW